MPSILDAMEGLCQGEDVVFCRVPNPANSFAIED